MMTIGTKNVLGVILAVIAVTVMAACSNGNSPYSMTSPTSLVPPAEASTSLPAPTDQAVTPPQTPAAPPPTTVVNPPTPPGSNNNPAPPQAPPQQGTECNQPSRGNFTFSGPGVGKVVNTGPNAGMACTNTFFSQVFFVPQGQDPNIIEGQIAIPGSEGASGSLKPGQEGTFDPADQNFLQKFIDSMKLCGEIVVQSDAWMTTRGTLYNTAGGQVHKVQGPTCITKPTCETIKLAITPPTTVVNSTSVVATFSTSTVGTRTLMVNFGDGSAEQTATSGTSISRTYARGETNRTYTITVYDKEFGQGCAKTITINVPKKELPPCVPDGKYTPVTDWIKGEPPPGSKILPSPPHVPTPTPPGMVCQEVKYFRKMKDSCGTEWYEIKIRTECEPKK